MSGGSAVLPGRRVSLLAQVADSVFVNLTIRNLYTVAIQASLGTPSNHSCRAATAVATMAPTRLETTETALANTRQKPRRCTAWDVQPYLTQRQVTACLCVAHKHAAKPCMNMQMLQTAPQGGASKVLQSLAPQSFRKRHSAQLELCMHTGEKTNSNRHSAAD